MNLSQYPIPHPQVAARIVDGSAVIVLADSGEVNVLNPVGSRVWELADGKRTGQEIVQRIVAEYEVTAEQATQDVQSFLQTLLDANAITLQNHPTTNLQSPISNL
ncbi:MAG: PqqD family protein [Chloroflexi bacterium]|nr:PqqD family protein [Chloroflexota bacterium]